MQKRNESGIIPKTVSAHPSLIKTEVIMKKPLLYLIRSAVIGALYFVLTTVLAPISYGVVQFRVAEALTILPFLFPEATIGLVIGCAFANISSPFGLLDIIVGAVVTGVAGFITSKIKNIWLAPLPPILLNAIFLPIVWGIVGTEQLYVINFLSLIASQAVVTYVLGVPFCKALKRFFPTKKVS